MKGDGRCADRDTWRDVLEERVAERDRAGLLAHLDECPECAATFADLAAQWSLATLAREGAAAGPATLALRDQLAAAHPAATPPRIPGIAGLELAGRGGMGAVFRGRDERLGRIVAVKVLVGPGVLSDAARARAEREARVLALLDHPHIVRIHAAGEADGLPYIVMEWIEGRTLQARIAAGVLPPREAAAIALDLARALAAVHAVGVVHRDLKPENVLLARAADASGGETPKLVDFGLARPEGAGLTRATSVLGTPSSMAPEQTGLEPALGGVTAATDIHGVGAVLYAMLAGRPPYDADTPGESLRRAARAEAPPLSAVAPRAPADLRTILETCLRYEPGRRYASAALLAADLERFLAGQPIAARPAGPVARLRGWARRHPAAAVAAALGLVLVVAAAAGTGVHVARLERARAAAAASRDAAVAAHGRARQSLVRLTDESIEGMLRRGTALNDKDREFLRSVRDEYRRWPLEPDAAAALHFRARGLERVATLFLGVDQFAEALECQELVIEALDEMERRGLGGADNAVRRLDAEAGRRQLLHRLGRLPEFTAATQAAVADLEGRAAVDPALRGRLAATLVELAIAAGAAGDHAAGGPLLDRAVGILAAATAAAPDDPAPLGEEIRALYNAAILAHNAGRGDERRLRLERLVKRCDHGLGRFPERESAWQRGLLLGLTGLADCELAAGRPEQALALAERRERVARAAAAARPDDPLMVGESVDAAIQLAACHEALGRTAESRAPLARAVRLAESAVAREPAVYDRSRVLAMALVRQTRVLELLGETAAAVATVDRLVVVLAPWQDREEAGLAIADQQATAGRLLAAAGDRAAAVERLERALAIVPEQGRPSIASRLDAVRSAAAEPR